MRETIRDDIALESFSKNVLYKFDLAGDVESEPTLQINNRKICMDIKFFYRIHIDFLSLR